MVSFAPKVPENAPIVVRTKPNTRAMYTLLLTNLSLLCTAIAVPLIWPFLLPALLVNVPGLLFSLSMTLLAMREFRALLGPQLAADYTGLWVRTGAGRQPEVVYLPWAAVEAIDVDRRCVRVISRHGEWLHPKRAHYRWESTRRRFGSPFVVDGRRTIEHPDQIVQRLQQTAQHAAMGWRA